jgi:hypothetical protein
VYVRLVHIHVEYSLKHIECIPAWFLVGFAIARPGFFVFLWCCSQSSRLPEWPSVLSSLRLFWDFFKSPIRVKLFCDQQPNNQRQVGGRHERNRYQTHKEQLKGVWGLLILMKLVKATHTKVTLDLL